MKGVYPIRLLNEVVKYEFATRILWNRKRSFTSFVSSQNSKVHETNKEGK